VATPSSIVAFLATARSAGLTDQAMVDILDYAIASGIADDGRVVVSSGANGFQVTMSYEQAQRMRAYYKEEVRKASPSVIASPEFNFFGSSGLDS
jgi:hypothetical protein